MAAAGTTACTGNTERGETHGDGGPAAGDRAVVPARMGGRVTLNTAAHRKPIQAVGQQRGSSVHATPRGVAQVPKVRDHAADKDTYVYCVANSPHLSLQRI